MVTGRLGQFHSRNRPGLWLRMIKDMENRFSSANAPIMPLLVAIILVAALIAVLTALIDWEDKNKW